MLLKLPDKIHRCNSKKKNDYLGSPVQSPYRDLENRLKNSGQQDIIPCTLQFHPILENCRIGAYGN